MNLQPAAGKEESSILTGALIQNALLLDLEVSHSGKLLKLGAVRGERRVVRPGTALPEEIAHALDALSASATSVVGHNLVEHDLPFLRARAPSLLVHQLPVIDTLVLSPICFPENPYHRLVKDHKLVRESLNDPVADALLAARLFQDEVQALESLRRNEPRLFEALHYLLSTPDNPEDMLATGLGMVFSKIGGAAPSRDRAAVLCREWIAQWACSSVPIEKEYLETRAGRLALAYALTWLRVAGSNSVLPPWVRLKHPKTRELLNRLREVPCESGACAYCRRLHNSREQLRAFFKFDAFRGSPANAAGGSLQQDIVEAGLRNESLLAILPTGGGKSLCFQLPALVRNYRTGVLTIVISPLQALMKDQVDGLIRRTDTPLAAALYGMLTPLERQDVLRRIRLGDVALLYVSPEQLRNRSFVEAIRLREIGCWVFDEAHCLSKWGHDFRPDYLYAGRFIRQFAERQKIPIPPIACFTATARHDVISEIVAFFQNETGRDLRLFGGGVERDNLRFEVQAIGDASKLSRVLEVLQERMPDGRPGAAIVFRATRKDAELTAEFLQANNFKAAHFHAGLTAPEKKRIQDQFIGDETRVICATNAFGMGIDKENVRLVIHADTPGSLENYFQEAGRAGRDGISADCVLLYSDEDCERQFRMGASAELSRRDIAQILRTLRKAARGDKQELVMTTGEILRDDEAPLEMHDRQADTKVRTAVSWLERSGFLLREENVTNVFQAVPVVRNLDEARVKIAPLNLHPNEAALWIAVLRVLFNAGPEENLTVDRLALLPEFSAYAKANPLATASPELLSAKVLKILDSMAQVALIKRDLRLTAFVRHKVADHSRVRFDRLVALDRKLVDVLATEDPDPEDWVPLSLRQLNQRLCDEGFDSSPELVRALLKSLAEDGRGFAGTQGSLELRHYARDAYRVKLRRNWTAIGELAQRRRDVASVVLDTLMARIPDEAPPRADHLLEFHFEELRTAIEQDLSLRSEIRDINAAIERALMFLHEQYVIVLQKGLAIFRSAMTIRLQPEARGEKYKASDYQPLEHHYQERVLQVHVMSEYARLGLQQIQAALELVLAYFNLAKEQFLHLYFRAKPELVRYATTARSFQRIVTDLENSAQKKVVTAPPGRNMLILAGPGSGKTTTVVHRCAYLLRVERVPPQSILVCCFNRQAAIQLRSRLADLVGDDAWGVTVGTYHSLAMRLLGFSSASRAGGEGEINLDALIPEATKLLRGEKVPPGYEADEVRDRVLGGFQYILVDEYQDIDAPQYEMISAIAGRTQEDPDLRLSILAVGDDDQNIYTFRGANVEFIRRFQQDYQAEVHYLVENYRSTRHIIDVANDLIVANKDRMKTEHPIRIDRHRLMMPSGGEFGARDPIARGQVQLVQIADAVGQAQAVIAELQRLRGLGVMDWSAVAVLSRSRKDLAQVRTLAEKEGIPVRWVVDRKAFPPLHGIRELHRFFAQLQKRRGEFKRAGELLDTATKLDLPKNPWSEFLFRLLESWKNESADAAVPVVAALDFLYDACAESRREVSWGGGVTLSTVHSAKGTEYDHVLVIGQWPLKPDRAAQEEERRTFYVGLTRARKTLAVFDRMDARPSLPATLYGKHLSCSVFKGSGEKPGFVDYEVLGLKDIHIGYPSRFIQSHPIHSALSALNSGDILKMEPVQGEGVGLFNKAHALVGMLSRSAAESWSPRLSVIREVRIVAMMHRTAEEDPDESRRALCKVGEWEFPLVEVVHE